MSEPLDRDWYLFDADDPRRAEQVMQRLRVEGRTLVVEQGTFSDWNPVEVARRLTRWGVERALEARLAEARARGLACERDPFVVLDRLSAHHPELEAAIRAIDKLDSEAGREALEVYADFLQAQGDARGTLAMLQLRDPKAKATRRYLADHGAQILGPLALHRRSLEATWVGGWIITLSVTRDQFGDMPWTEFLRLPACACLRSLSGPYVALKEVWPHRPASLRSVVIEGGVDLSSIRALLDGLPGGSLEHFGFQIPWFIEPEQLRALLEHDALRSLRGIALSFVTTPFDDGLFEIGPLAGPLLDVLLEAPLLHRLELRDFSGMEVADPQAVRRAFAAAPGETLILEWSRPTRP